MIKELLACALERFAPRFIWRHRVNTWALDTGEDEEILLPWVCDPNKISIDIGAFKGLYAFRLLLYSSRVVAFEPQPESAEELRELFRHTSLVTVEQKALSDESGTAELRCPVGGRPLSTIETTNKLEESRPELINTLVVKRERLDAYDFKPVGFIKIDVEGHENAVLAGAARTIERERPALLIEIERRYNPDSMSRVSAMLSALDYSAYFLMEGKLLGLEQFSAEIHQNPANLEHNRRVGTYINNFLFLPKERVKTIPPQFAAGTGS